MTDKDLDRMTGLSSQIPYGARLALDELCLMHGATKTIKGELKPCITTLLRMLASNNIKTVLRFDVANITQSYPYSRGKRKDGQEKNRA